MPEKRLVLIVLGISAAVLASLMIIHTRGFYTFWSAGSVDRISATQAQELIEQKRVIILDARSKEEFDVSHLPGAIHYSADLLNNLNPKESVLVYCTISLRSNSLAKEMSKKGFSRVYDVTGGLISWVNNQYDLVNGDNHKTDTLHSYNKWLAPFVQKGTPVY